jgi:hypothetical protein
VTKLTAKLLADLNSWKGRASLAEGQGFHLEKTNIILKARKKTKITADHQKI